MVIFLFPFCTIYNAISQTHTLSQLKAKKKHTHVTISVYINECISINLHISIVFAVAVADGAAERRMSSEVDEVVVF